MDLGRFVVEEHLRTRRPVGELARSYGVDPSWIYKRLKRYRLEGAHGLEPRSRRPRTSPTRITDLFEDEIVELRKELLDLGVDGGAQTIHAHLERCHRARCPRLRRSGGCSGREALSPRSHTSGRSPPIPLRSRPAERAVAGRHDPLGAGRRHHGRGPNVIDDHSRLCVASRLYKTVRSADVVRTLHVAAATWGYPATMLTDNGRSSRRSPGGGEAAMEAELWSRRHHHPALASLPPPDLRQGRTLPPDLEKVSGRPGPTRDYEAAPGPAEPVLPLLQRGSAAHRANRRRTPLEAWNAKGTGAAERAEDRHHRIPGAARQGGPVAADSPSAGEHKLHHIGVGQPIRRHPGAWWCCWPASR